MNMDQFVVSLLVANHFGVLTRISALFSRRGFNIDSLTVGVTEDPEVSRMTIVTSGDEYIKDQIVKQLQKLVDVKTVQLMDLNRTVVRELLVVKIRIDPGKLSEIVEAVKTYRAHAIDLSPDSMIIEITGEPPKLSAFLNYIQNYGIVEMARTGPTAMGRSTYCLAD